MPTYSCHSTIFMILYPFPIFIIPSPHGTSSSYSSNYFLCLRTSDYVLSGSSCPAGTFRKPISSGSVPSSQKCSPACHFLTSHYFISCSSSLLSVVVLQLDPSFTNYKQNWSRFLDFPINNCFSSICSCFLQTSVLVLVACSCHVLGKCLCNYFRSQCHSSFRKFWRSSQSSFLI